MLAINTLITNEKLKKYEFIFDSNYINSNIDQDKIVDIRYDKKQYEETITEIKRKILYNSNFNLIQNYISHIDSDEYYYIKDLYNDLSFPFNVNNKENKLNVIVNFLKDIFQNVFKEYYEIKNIKVSNTSYYKKAIDKIFNENLIQNLCKNEKNKLYIVAESKLFKKQIELTSNVFLSNLEPKKQIIRELILKYINDKHLNLVKSTIEDMVEKINFMNIGDSLIYKINILNSKKIQFVLDYLTTIFKTVSIITPIVTDVIKEEFFIVCHNKISENHLESVPKISHLYMSENYSYINQLIYFMKIYRKHLINIFMAIDNYYIRKNTIVNEYEKFQIYFKDLLQYDYYKQHLKRIGYLN